MLNVLAEVTDAEAIKSNPAPVNVAVERLTVPVCPVVDTLDVKEADKSLEEALTIPVTAPVVPLSVIAIMLPHNFH